MPGGIKLMQQVFLWQQVGVLGQQLARISRHIQHGLSNGSDERFFLLSFLERDCGIVTMRVQHCFTKMHILLHCLSEKLRRMHIERQAFMIQGKGITR